MALPRPRTALDDHDLNDRNLTVPDLSDADLLPSDGPLSNTARAYCGVAHGFTWQVTAEHRPPPLVHLGALGCEYRLAVHPTNQRPARDHLGNYVYVPGR